MAQPQAQRDFICPVRGNRAWEFAFKKRKKSPFLFFLAPCVIEIHQVSWAMKRQHGWVTRLSPGFYSAVWTKPRRPLLSPSAMLLGPSEEWWQRLTPQTKSFGWNSKQKGLRWLQKPSICWEKRASNSEAEFYLYKYMYFIHQRWTRVLLRNYWFQV